MSKAGKRQREIDIKCREVIQAMLYIVNSGGPFPKKKIIFEQDIASDVATILMPNGEHFHIGAPGEGFDFFVDRLHNLFERKMDEVLEQDFS